MMKFCNLVGAFALVAAAMALPVTAEDANNGGAAVQITPAPAVPVVPIGQPFKLRPGEVHDLPSGEMLSFRFSSSLGDISITAGSERSNSLYTGHSFIPSTGCQIDYIDSDREDPKTETAILRVSKC